MVSDVRKQHTSTEAKHFDVQKWFALMITFITAFVSVQHTTENDVLCWDGGSGLCISWTRYFLSSRCPERSCFLHCRPWWSVVPQATKQLVSDLVPFSPLTAPWDVLLLDYSREVQRGTKSAVPISVTCCRAMMKSTHVFSMEGGVLLCTDSCSDKACVSVPHQHQLTWASAVSGAELSARVSGAFGFQEEYGYHLWCTQWWKLRQVKWAAAVQNKGQLTSWLPGALLPWSLLSHPACHQTKGQARQVNLLPSSLAFRSSAIHSRKHTGDSSLSPWCMHY